MGKDPAVLWYYRDYLEGTELMSWAEQGAYARLLNKQADKGSLSIDLIKKILKKDFERIWPAISGKFLIDDEGHFYNERMSLEVDKRKKNSKHQKDKAEERWRKERQSRGNAAAYATAMPLANADANAIQEGGPGEEKIPLGIDRVSEVAGQVWGNQRWVEAICMGQMLQPEALKKWMAQFNSSICNDFVPDFDKSKYQKLFNGWLNRQKSKGYSLQHTPLSQHGAPPLKPVS